MISSIIVNDMVHFLEMMKIRCVLRMQSRIIRIQVPRAEKRIRVLYIENYLRRHILPKSTVLFVDRKLWLFWPWKIKVFDSEAVERKDSRVNRQGESWHIPIRRKNEKIGRRK